MRVWAKGSVLWSCLFPDVSVCCRVLDNMSDVVTLERTGHRARTVIILRALVRLMLYCFMTCESGFRADSVLSPTSSIKESKIDKGLPERTSRDIEQGTSCMDINQETSTTHNIILPLPSFVVTSFLTSPDVRLTSGLRSPDQADEAPGSITHLRFV